MQNPIRRLVLAFTAVLALLAAACGGHDTSEPSEDAGAATSEASSRGSSPQGDVAGQFGTMDEAVCGPGDAAGSTDQGVTDDAIKVGTISDPGNTILPGLLEELFDASEAFVEWCNAAGGINGRPIELTLRDTKLLEGQARITEACAEDFMLVGGASGLDATLVEPRLACDLPQIPAFVNDPAAQEAGLQVTPGGNYPDYLTATQYRLGAEQYPEEMKHFGLLSTALQGSGTPASVRVPKALQPYGIETVYSGEAPAPPATVDNWRPYVADMRADGAEVVEVANVASNVVAIMNTMADAGFTPTAMLGNPSLYDTALIDGNDALADIPMYVNVTVYPFELADDNPPTQQFLDLMDATTPGWSESPKALAVNSWSAWLLFAQAATACGSDLTRDCVMEQAAAAGTWDAGGIAAPVDISVGEPAGPLCGTMMQATPDGFVYDEDFTQPNEGIFNCSEENRAPAPR